MCPLENKSESEGERGFGVAGQDENGGLSICLTILGGNSCAPVTRKSVSCLKADPIILLSD